MNNWKLFFLLLFFSLIGFSSCEETPEVGEYDNWQARNITFIDSIASVARANSDGKWKVFSATGLDENKEWGNEYNVYCNILNSGSGVEHPAFTDTVELYYTGRLMPSKSYPKGFLFDSSYDGELEPEFDPTVKMLLDGTVPGFYTAVQQMVDGDKWLVYIPSNLGYGAEVKGGIPAYSALIFEIDLVSFSSAGVK